MTMAKRCKTCELWGAEWVGTCSIIRTGGCSDLATVRVEHMDGDGSGYLDTKPEFGCVEWIPKRMKKARKTKGKNK
jgi:hypothetical protein